MMLERKKLEKKMPVVFVNIIMNVTALFFILSLPFIAFYFLFKNKGFNMEPIKK